MTSTPNPFASSVSTTAGKAGGGGGHPRVRTPRRARRRSGLRNRRLRGTSVSWRGPQPQRGAPHRRRGAPTAPHPHVDLDQDVEDRAPASAPREQGQPAVDGRRRRHRRPPGGASQRRQPNRIDDLVATEKRSRRRRRPSPPPPPRSGGHPAAPARAGPRQLDAIVRLTWGRSDTPFRRPARHRTALRLTAARSTTSAGAADPSTATPRPAEGRRSGCLSHQSFRTDARRTSSLTPDAGRLSEGEDDGAADVAGVEGRRKRSSSERPPRCLDQRVSTIAGSTSVTATPWEAHSWRSEWPIPNQGVLAGDVDRLPGQASLAGRSRPSRRSCPRRAPHLAQHGRTGRRHRAH